MLKKIILFIIIFLLFIGSVILYLLFIQEDKVVVLTYHNIVNNIPNKKSVDISVDTFEKQIKWLYDSGFESLSLDDLYDWKVNNKKISRKSIVITFDDGWESFYSKAIPILEKYNMKGNVFVIFNRFIEDKNKENLYLNKEEINDIIKNHKNMTISSHSYNLHYKEASLSNDYNLYFDDIKRVKEIIDTKYYAYPYGRHSENYIKALKDYDYKLAFTFGPYDYVRKSDNNFEIPRMGVFESTDEWKFKIKMIFEV